MKRLFSILAFFVATISSYAFDFEEDGIGYYVDDRYTAPYSGTATVSAIAYNYSGSIVIPSTVTHDGFTYPVTAISGGLNCPGLTSITIPSSVESIVGMAFMFCPGLASIIVESGNSKYDSRDNCNAVIETKTNTLTCGCKNTKIPESVSSIGFGAFYNCDNLKSITIPNSVTSIGYLAFSSCDNLKSITIPNSVTSIEEAFSYCRALLDVYCEAETVPTTVLNAFENTSATLHVPAASLEAYKSTAPWSQFNYILCIEGEHLTDGEVFDNAEQNECVELTYKRTFSETLVGKWSALYVPFSFNVEDYLEDFDIAEIYAVCPSKDTNGDGDINSNDANTLVINKKKTGTTLPNIPYLIRPKEAKTYIITSADNVLYPAEVNSITCSTTTDVYTFTGHYETTTAVGNKQYYMTADGILDYSPSSPISIKPNRWIMSVESHGYGNSSAPSVDRAISIKVIGEDDETNGIESIKADRNDGNIYNLNGVKMNSENIPAGIYIKNGKKIVVK